MKKLIVIAGLALVASVTNAADNMLHISSVDLQQDGTNVQIIVTCPADRLEAFHTLTGDTNTMPVFVTKLVDTAARQQISMVAAQAAQAAQKRVFDAVK